MLDICSLNKSFKSKEVLRNLNLSVSEKSVLGFVGKNGSGKTTTMKIILGLLKADEGDVYLSGEKVKFGENKTNQYIGFLPDVPEFYEFMTAEEYLKFCAELCDANSKQSLGYIAELIDLVGLENDKKHKIKGYSRGMKQRLGIAQALIKKPKLLICDEPTSALDPIGRKEILDIISNVSTISTVIFSTHILSDVEKICTDIALLDDGVIKINGKIKDIKNALRTEEYYLETSAVFAQALTEAFPSIKQLSDSSFIFPEKEQRIFDLTRFITEKEIPIHKLEQIEPNIESFILEVLQK